MGIRGLNSFIKKTCPECITINKITKYQIVTSTISTRRKLRISKHLKITSSLIPIGPQARGCCKDDPSPGNPE